MRMPDKPGTLIKPESVQNMFLFFIFFPLSFPHFLILPPVLFLKIETLYSAEGIGIFIADTCPHS